MAEAKSANNIFSSAPSPFSDAVAFWSMRDLQDGSANHSNLSAFGEVETGIELKGDDRDSSLARHGDGFVAAFNGGWLSAGQGQGGILNIQGHELSICIRLRDSSGTWNCPIFAKHGGHENLTYNLFSADVGHGLVLGFEMGTTGNKSVLSVTAPLSGLDPKAWHDVICRSDGVKVQLFVDGVFKDEDFVVGDLRQGNNEPCLIGAESYGDKTKSGFNGLMDHVAIWNRNLTDEEVAQLSGFTSLDDLQRDISESQEGRVFQYFTPNHPSWNVGDCLPFYDGQTFHFLYLADKGHHSAKNGLGAHQWAHASTQDLVHWTHHPLAVPLDQSREGSICTGSMFLNQGIYRAYYATRMADGSGEHVSVALSQDGVHFTKSETDPVAAPSDPYIPGPFRDPTVFQDPQTGIFHMLVTASLAKPDLYGRGGCLAHLTSLDLETWNKEEPFLVTGYTGDPECPDWFFWQGWYYLVFSHHGVAHYRMSRHPLGPWHRPEVDTFDGPMAKVLKTAGFAQDRRIGVAWLPQGGFGGNAIFREIKAMKDGLLGTGFVPEMMPPTGAPLPLSWHGLTWGATAKGDDIHIAALEGFEAGFFSDIPGNVFIRLHVHPKPGSSAFGLAVRGSGAYEKGLEIRFSPFLRKVEVRDLLCDSIQENEERAIYNVSDLDKPFVAEIVIKDDILDICIDQRRTLVARVPNLQGDRLFLFGHNAEATFHRIQVAPLQPHAE